MDLQSIDYIGQAEERVTQQFKDKPRLLSLLISWLRSSDEIQNTLLDIQLINDIENSSGLQLDVIGRIIGQPRELEDISATGFFGFDSDPAAESFGSTENALGGLYFSLQSPEDASGTVLLPDDVYRTFLRSKIIQNNAGGNPEEIIQIVQDIFDTDVVELFEGGSDPGEPAVFTLNIGRDWNDKILTVYPGLDETQVADRLIPRPAGVRIEYIDTYVDPTLIAALSNWEPAANRLSYTANTFLTDFQ